MPRRSPGIFTLLSVILLGACASTDRLSTRSLHPPADWLVEPGQLGLETEEFDLDAGAGSLTGWLIRAPHANGRTVLLFHDSRTNASMLHPYYTFLVGAGLNVCAFDYRGFGRSKGEPTLWAMFYDMPVLLDWLRARPGIDPDRIAFYGLSVGSDVALHTAAEYGGCRALVVEEAPSFRDMIHDQLVSDSGEVASVFGTGAIEFMSLPERAEASENAARLRQPSLWICGEEAPRAELRQTLRAYVEMGGDKQLWILPRTGSEPDSLLTHDGEYQRAVAGFLCSTLGGEPERVGVSWRRLRDADGGASWWEVALDRHQAAGASEPWAVQVCALDADGAASWQNAWMDGAREVVRMKLPKEPGVVGAMRVAAVERTEAGAFRSQGTPLSRAGRWYAEQANLIDDLRTSKPTLQQAKDAATAILARGQVEPLPPLLEAELADVFAIIGRTLTDSTDAADKARGLVWLHRAVAAAPARPERHYWPGRTATFGFPHADAVAAARQRLEHMEGQGAAR